jgi:hypothetical protein
LGVSRRHPGTPLKSTTRAASSARNAFAGLARKGLGDTARSPFRHFKRMTPALTGQRSVPSRCPVVDKKKGLIEGFV